MKIDFKKLKSEAAGKWDSIIPALDSRISEKYLNGKHGPCPVHGTGADNNDDGDGFRLFRDFKYTGGAVCNTCGFFPDGLSLLQWLAGESSVRPAALSVHALITNGEVKECKQSKKAPVKRDTSKIKAAAIKTWGNSNSHVSAEARMYYSNRGLDDVAQHASIKYHDNAPYFDAGRALVGPNKRWLTWPAIVCKMTNSSGTVGLVQIYLNSSGYRAQLELQKAGAVDPVDKRFMSFESLVGSAVRIGTVGEEIAITEGVETGLAVRQLTGLPVAMTCTAALMTNVEIPLSVKRVFIYADKDRSGAGQQAAEKLKQLIENDYELVEIRYPDLSIPENKKGVDWLDSLNSNDLCLDSNYL